MEFDEIYVRYFGDVYRFLLKLSGNRDLAEELTSETFFKAMKAIDGFRGQCSLSVWLCQIAKNTYYTYNKKSRRLSGENELPALAEDDVSERVADRDTADRLRKKLHALPDPYREVFMWRVFAEMNFSEIGALFGKSANWACVTYHRARKMLAEKTEDEK